MDRSDDARATLVRFTARGRKLLATVLELVEDIEGGFAARIGEDGFDRVREGLLAIADHIDPDGALGAADRQEPLPLDKTARRRTRPAARRR